MALTDPIGDMFSRIRNGQMRSLNSIEIPSSNFKTKISDNKFIIIFVFIFIIIFFIALQIYFFYENKKILNLSIKYTESKLFNSAK